MPRTSNKAQMIVDYVNQFIQENGYSPSVREIGAAVGLRSTASVSYHLQALQDQAVFLLAAGGILQVHGGILPHPPGHGQEGNLTQGQEQLHLSLRQFHAAGASSAAGAVSAAVSTVTHNHPPHIFPAS
jgi:SOS-response transcriptional repressor LexA